MLGTICRVGHRFATKGPVETIRWIRTDLDELFRERWLVIRTAAEAPEADWSSEECQRYEPMCYQCIETALNEIDIDSYRLKGMRSLVYQTRTGASESGTS